MEGKRRTTYRDAGVDIDAQDRALGKIARLVEGTRTPGVLSGLGTFGGLYAPDFSGVEEPVLVSTCDGVGTKLRVAFSTGIHDTVGRDLVNHCVNDVLVHGARPLYFLDYLATGRLEPDVLASVVSGIAAGCRDNGCALLGGETAEMPGFYADGEYDVAGFLVGVVPRRRLLDGSRVRVGDVLVGLASNGLHTNGYSLARKVLFDGLGLDPGSRVDALGSTVAEALLAVHRSYLPVLADALDRDLPSALVHVTGGGLTDNVPRVLPPGTAARVDRGSWPVPPLFRLIAEGGGVDEAEMLRAFNMGVGMVVVAPPDCAREIEAALDRAGETHWRIGAIEAGDRRVRYA
jgi:phosphoribosylformylglycinamidine cyclo-ligase